LVRPLGRGFNGRHSLLPPRCQQASRSEQVAGDMGCFAHITDSEGNRVGLHSLA
jgi:hypothetical protein